MVVQLNAKLKKFLIGSSTENLSESIALVDDSLKNLESFRKDMEHYLTTVEARLKMSVQAVHTVRFNPFKGTTDSGGNQSFATAFLNESGTGVVISTLYARERMSVFSKPITKGAPTYELSIEEKEAVNGALAQLKNTATK
jgi:hypothetical protein